MDLLSESTSNYLLSILIPLILIIILFLLVNEHSEPFIAGRYCSECANLDPYECNGCINCGLCYGYNGISECVPGDEFGPYFREDCATYRYKSPVYYHPMPIVVDPYDYYGLFWPWSTYWKNYDYHHKDRNDSDKKNRSKRNKL